MVIVKDVPAFIELVRGRLFVPAMISLFTGMRIGEVLALRWGRVDLDRKVVEVRGALEETKAHGTRFKAPKTKAGRRDITLPDLLVPRHSDYDWLIPSQFRMGRSLGATRIWMLRATPGCRRMRPFRSSVTIIWWTEGGLT